MRPETGNHAQKWRNPKNFSLRGAPHQPGQANARELAPSRSPIGAFPPKPPPVRGLTLPHARGLRPLAFSFTVNMFTVWSVNGKQ